MSLSVLLPLRIPELLQQLLPRLPRIAEVALGLLIAGQAFALWHEWPARPGAAAGTARPLPAPRHFVDAAAIARAGLFGKPPPAAGSLDPANAHDGHDGYTLRGIMALEGQDDGFAIIAGPDGNSRVLRKGQTLNGRLTVGGIWASYVLLMDGDTIERLTLPHGTLGGGPRSPRMAAARAPATPVPAKVISEGTQGTLSFYGLNTIGDPRSQITGLAGRGAPGWVHSGLLPTDVIIAIDGKPIDEVLKTPNAIDEASVAAVTTLTIERDGAQMQIEATPYDASPPLSPTPRRRDRG